MFPAGAPLEVRCDYCGQVYAISREDLMGEGGPA
jgi:redox-regulated HSP33 family molecular chaperone